MTTVVTARGSEWSAASIGVTAPVGSISSSVTAWVTVSGAVFIEKSIIGVAFPPRSSPPDVKETVMGWPYDVERNRLLEVFFRCADQTPVVSLFGHESGGIPGWCSVPHLQRRTRR